MGAGTTRANQNVPTPAADQECPDVPATTRQGQVAPPTEGPSIELLGQLCNDNHAIGKPLADRLTLDLDCWAIPRSLLSTEVRRRVRKVQERGDPGDVACQLDVTVDQFGVHIGIEHHGSPSSEHLLGVLSEKSDLVVETHATRFVVEN